MKDSQGARRGKVIQERDRLSWERQNGRRETDNHDKYRMSDRKETDNQGKDRMSPGKRQTVMR